MCESAAVNLDPNWRIGEIYLYIIPCHTLWLTSIWIFINTKVQKGFCDNLLRYTVWHKVWFNAAIRTLHSSCIPLNTFHMLKFHPKDWNFKFISYFRWTKFLLESVRCSFFCITMYSVYHKMDNILLQLKFDLFILLQLLYLY